MAEVLGGPVTWNCSRDDEGFRTYKVTWRVKAEVTESPVAVMLASGLPSIGTALYIIGFTGIDYGVWCRPEMSVRIDQEKTGDPAQYYLVECTYSNNWKSGKSQRCQNTSIDDPLLEPMKISGSFSKGQYLARYDKDKLRLVTSANETLYGPDCTFDYAKPTVHIEQNVGSLGLSTFAGMVNTVNDRPLWGVPTRCVKLVHASWDRKVYGQCNFFYTRAFEFEIDCYNKDTNGNLIGFDKEISDSGEKMLRGEWQTHEKLANGSPNPDYGAYKILCSTKATTSSNLSTISEGDLVRVKDMNGEYSRMLLDGKGRPANARLIDAGGDSVAGPNATKVLQYYQESNFLMLGIPVSF
jgi:hypothetical protein